MIPFRCDHCGKDLKVKDELAGKKVKCPGCQKPVSVPQPAASVSPPPNERDERTLPPKGPAIAEERTLPPAGKRESISDAGGHTVLGAGQVESTQAPFSGAKRELYDFLAPPEQPNEIGRLGGFRILKVLGAGGMGVVFQAEDPKLKRKLAIKAMLPALAASESAKQRFLREAQTAAAIEHDHIVPILQVGEDRSVPFIAMPFLKGEPLDERLKREQVLPLAVVLRIGRETAEGLTAAHKSGLIHRDIKPANLWLEGEKGRIKILDFGLARAAAGESGLTQTGAIVGTPQYMAPEQAAGKKDIDHRCDLFSLGCVLYRISTGQLPFKGDDTLAIISSLAMDKPKKPSKVNKSVPQPLSNLIMHLLAKNPDDRPQSAQEVAEAIAQLAAKDTAEMPARAGKTTLFRKPRSLASGRKWALIAAALVLLVAVGGVALFLRSGKTDPGRGSQDTGSLPATFTNSLGMEFVLVPKGKSWLGGGGGNPGNKEVEIKEDFYLGKYEVTQEEWEKVTGLNPSQFKAVAGIGKEDQKRFPVEQVSWDDCQVFIERLNKQVKDVGWVYRLPKEAEWEYACRGGPGDKFESAFDFYFEKPSDTLLPEQANFQHGKGLKQTCKVGSFKANKLGLYDMHGNVWEWCQDEAPDLNNPKGASPRVIRGGSWNRDSGNCRAARGNSPKPSIRSRDCGLRLARVPIGKEIVKLIAPEEKKPAVETAGEKKNPATTPMNRDIQRHKQFLAIAKKGGVEVLFLGDSITQAWEGQKAWKSHFEPLKAANFGIAGDQTGHVLWRLTEGGELEGITPKVAVLMIGTNNSGRDSAEQAAEGITLIIKTIHAKSPTTKVLLLGVFPRGAKAGTPIREKITKINDIVSKLDDKGKTVKYLDIGGKFLESDGTLTKEVMPDFLHLSPRGYEIWAEAITPTLKAMLK